jgi:hypothetical protein
MESSLEMPALEKHSQLSAWRQWGKVVSPPGAIPASLPTHNLLGISPRIGALQVLGGQTQQLLAELRVTR